MPALTFDEFDVAPSGGGISTIPAQGGRPARVIMDMSQTAPGSSGALTFDEFMPESGLEKAGRYAEDIGRSVVSGLDAGVAGLAGLPSFIGSIAQAGVELGQSAVQGRPLEEVHAERAKDYVIPSETLEHFSGPAIHQRSGLAHRPQTTAGEYAHTIGEFAPNALIPGGMAARAGQVLAPALASETAGQATKGRAIEPYARFAGALAGGIGAAVASRPGTAARALQGQMPEGVTPQMVDQAEALMGQARQQGIDLSWPEALSQVTGRPVLSNTMRHLEASPQTEAQMAEFFARRPQQVEQAARGQFDQFAPVNPAPSTIGREVGRAAEGEVTDMRQAINATSQPYYDAAALTEIPAADMARIRAVPGYDIARRAIERDPQLSRYVQGLPENSVGYVNEIKKYLDQAAENAAGPMNVQRNQQRAAGFGQDAALMRETAVRNSPEYETALAIQQQGREQFLQPLLDGYIGKLASRDTTTQNAINALFPKNPLPNSQAEIADTVGRLAARNQRAARDLVRAHIESVFNQSAKDLQTGANQAGGAKFRAQLIANPQQRANLQAAIEALPNGADRWQGFNRFLDILEATGTRQGIGSRTAYNEQFFKEAAKGGVAGDIVKTGANPLSMGQRFVDRYQQWKLGRNLGDLAGILTNPGSGNMLRAIARAPNQSAANAIALRLATSVNSARNER